MVTDQFIFLSPRKKFQRTQFIHEEIRGENRDILGF